jgi:hypothetical protein
VGVQVRWDRGGTTPAGEYTFFYERGMRIMNYVQVLSYIRESCQQLKGQNKVKLSLQQGVKIYTALRRQDLYGFETSRLPHLL